MTLTFLTLPLSTNQLYRSVNGRNIISERGRTNKEALGWEARAQYRGKPLTGPLKVDIALYWPDRRKHDVDNIKVLLDSITGIVWEDDGQIVDLHITKACDKKNPRAVVIALEAQQEAAYVGLDASRASVEAGEIGRVIH